MNTILLIFMSLFAVYGAVAVFRQAVLSCGGTEEKYLIVRLENSPDEAEVKLRSIISKYSNCQIAVVGDNLSGEVLDIVNHLCNDYDNLSIVCRKKQK